MQLLVVAFCVCVAVVVARPEDSYTTKFDNIDLDEILNSDRLLKNYVNCLNGSGKCTPDGSELKRNLPDALENDCTKCSKTQRDGAHKVVSHLVNKKSELWDELKGIYDPTGKYELKYKKEFELKN